MCRSVDTEQGWTLTRRDSDSELDDDTLRRLSDDDGALGSDEEEETGEGTLVGRPYTGDGEEDETSRRLGGDGEEQAVGEADESAADTGA